MYKFIDLLSETSRQNLQFIFNSYWKKYNRCGHAGSICYCADCTDSVN